MAMESNKQPMIEAADALGNAGMPVAVPPSAGARSDGRGNTGTINHYHIDVSVPNPMNPDTVSRSIADEVKSRNFN